MEIATTALIRSRVVLPTDASIGDFVIIGEWPDKSDRLKPETFLGPGSIIRSHTIMYAGVTAGENLQTGHSALIREHTTMGDQVSVGSHTVLEHHVTIGHRVRIHSGAFIPEFSILEDDCWIGPRVVLTNATHPQCVNLPGCLAGVTIRRGAKIGANVTILPGVIIGEGALVGAGAVVTKDVKPETVVTGSPARYVCNIKDLICDLDGTTAPYKSMDDLLK